MYEVDKKKWTICEQSRNFKSNNMDGGLTP